MCRFVTRSCMLFCGEPFESLLKNRRFMTSRTRLLQPSLSGSARISVICTINPAQSHIAESQSTLNFAAGIKRVVLNAKQTEVVDPAALIQQYQNEIAELKVSGVLIV